MLALAGSRLCFCVDYGTLKGSQLFTATLLNVLRFKPLKKTVFCLSPPDTGGHPGYLMQLSQSPKDKINVYLLAASLRAFVFNDLVTLYLR